MFGIETLGGTAQAVAIVGFVLVEALVLYVGYGAFQRVFGPAIARLLRGD